MPVIKGDKRLVDLLFQCQRKLVDLRNILALKSGGRNLFQDAGLVNS